MLTMGGEAGKAGTGDRLGRGAGWDGEQGYGSAGL